MVVSLGAGFTMAPTAGASAPDEYGFGSRGAAMAGAMAADASDFSAGYYNPAGLAQADGIEVALGYMYNHQRLRIDGVDTQVDDVHGLVGGVVAPGRLFGIPFGFSVGLHLPDDGVSYLRARRQGVPRWELYDTRAQLLSLFAGAAIRPWPFLAVGGGIGYLSSTRGDFGIRGRADALRPFDSELEHEVDADLTAVRFPHAGVRLLWDGWGALGVTYRGQSNLDLQLDALLDGVVSFAGIDIPLLYDLEAKTIAAFTPQQLAMGVSFTHFEGVTLNVDVTWMDWSAYLSPTAEIAASLDLDPPIDLPIELPEEPAPTVPIPPRFRDTWVPRVGLEVRQIGAGTRRVVHGRDRPLFELPLRAGYAFEASPVPPQTGVTNLVDTDRHVFSVGFGAILNRPVEELPGAVHLDAHASLSWLPLRVTLKDNPADFVGDYTADGLMVAGGGTLRVVF
ncbi:MAG: hypothetical protein AAF715_24445 [Myxococcota bacterium]